MTTLTYEGASASEHAPTLIRKRSGSVVVRWITSTDHKVIGYMYLITSFTWFIVGGILALLIRAELFQPGLQIVQSPEQYNQLFTMHGTIMLCSSRLRCSLDSRT